MSQRNRKIVALSAVALLSVGMAACSSGGGEEGGGGGEAEGPITMDYTYWGGPERIALHDELVAMYMDENPDITIESIAASSTADHIERLAVQASGGNLPDIVQQQDRFLLRFAESLLDLGPYIEDGTIDVSGISEADLAGGQVDGKQIMIPTGGAFHSLNYDPAILEAAGVTAPTNELTWEELADQSLALAESDALPEGTFAIKNGCYNYWGLYAWLKSHGVNPFDGSDVNFTAADVEEWFTYWDELRKAGATPTAEFQTEHEPEGVSPDDTMIAKGQVATALSPANQTTVKAEVRGTELLMSGWPLGPEGPGNVNIKSGVSIAANSDNPQAAAEFINWWANDAEAGISYGAANGVPLSGPQLEAVSGALPDLALLQTFAEFTEDNNIASFEPFPEASSYITDALPRFCDLVSYEQSSIPDAAEAFVAEVSAAR